MNGWEHTSNPTQVGRKGTLQQAQANSQEPGLLSPPLSAARPAPASSYSPACLEGSWALFPGGTE